MILPLLLRSASKHLRAMVVTGRTTDSLLHLPRCFYLLAPPGRFHYTRVARLGYTASQWDAMGCTTQCGAGDTVYPIGYSMCLVLRQ